MFVLSKYFSLMFPYCCADFSKPKVKFLLIARNAPWLISCCARRPDNMSKFWPFVRVHSAGQLTINGSIWFRLNVEPNMLRSTRSITSNYKSVPLCQNARLEYIIQLNWLNKIEFNLNQYLLNHGQLYVSFAFSEYNLRCSMTNKTSNDP